MAILNEQFEAVIAGAGFAGAVCARLLAEGGLRTLVIEKRPHLAGNAYDYTDGNGILIHKYGPHIFHTVDSAVFDFLSRFTDWNGYEHTVLADVGGAYLPVPFNLTSLYKAYPANEAQKLEQKLLNTYGAGQNVTISELLHSDDPALRSLGDYVYKNIFETYTVKQWGVPPERIDPATTARVPVRLSHDCRYFTDPYQGLPTDGYTKLFERMLAHDNITVRTGCDSADVIGIDLERGSLTFCGKPYSGIFVYTGAADALLSARFGALPYRTLEFEFETHDTPNESYFQPCGTVNYTVDRPYTRITEFKHMTLQKSDKTVILKEYSKPYTDPTAQTPFYPVTGEQSAALYDKYTAALSGVKNLYLLGRLAEFRYYNMDAAAARAMKLAHELLNRL